MKRHSKGKVGRDIIDGPQAQADYVTYFNAVDKNERDSADYSTTIRTLCYYLRIFCWVLDQVIHTIYVNVCYLVYLNPDRKRYLPSHTGRHDFQIDLGIALLDYGICLDWDGESKRPDWMRQMDRVPCDCKKCYFCLNGHTTGIDHRRKRELEVVYAHGQTLMTDDCTEDRVNIGMKGGRYFGMCYRKQADSLTQTEKKKRCNSSTLGCGQCREPICKSCWEEDGYDKHS